MQLYDFMEALFAKGANIAEVELVKEDSGLGEQTFLHTERLIAEFVEGKKSPSHTRRFGFDKGSYIGDLSVMSIKRKPSLRGGVLVGIGRPMAEKWDRVR